MSTTYSDGTRDDDRLSDAGRLLSSFMRLVERVRRNCDVKSAAHPAGNGWLAGDGCCCDACDCGTGFRRGTPLLLRSAMLSCMCVCVCIVCPDCRCLLREVELVVEVGCGGSSSGLGLRLNHHLHRPRTSFSAAVRCALPHCYSHSVRHESHRWAVDERADTAGVYGCFSSGWWCRKAKCTCDS